MDGGFRTSGTSTSSLVHDTAIVVALVDISGYTRLTALLADTFGNDGGSLIHAIITPIFCRVLSIVNKYGGVAVKAAGDSLTVCWSPFYQSTHLNTFDVYVLEEDATTVRMQSAAAPVDDVAAARRAALDCCREILREVSNYVVDLSKWHPKGHESWQLQVHIGLATGPCYHVMLHHPSRKDYVLQDVQAAGGTIARAGVLLNMASKGEMCVQSVFLDGPSPPNVTAVPNLGWKLGNETSDWVIARAKGEEQSVNVRGTICKVTTIFVHFIDMIASTPQETLLLYHRIFCSAVRTTEAFECDYRQLNYDDKGLTLFIACGVPPKVHEREEYGALQAAVSLFHTLEAIPGIVMSCGIGTSIAFSGDIGTVRTAFSTILGQGVNTAARLMCLKEATRGIVADKATAESAGKELAESSWETSLKGFATPQTVYKVPVQRSKRNLPNELLATKRMPGTDVVGKHKAKQLIDGWLDPWHDLSTKPMCFCIIGESGSGKSTLSGYALRKFHSDRSVVHFLSKASEIYRHDTFSVYRNILVDAFLLYEAYASSNPRPLSMVNERHSGSSMVHSLSKASNAGGSTNLTLSAETQRVLNIFSSLGQTYHYFSLMKMILPWLDVPESPAFRNLEPSSKTDLVANLLTSIFGVICRHTGWLPVLVLDDCQWMDTASWRVTKFLTKSASPLCLILVSRPLPEYKDRDTAQAMTAIQRECPSIQMDGVDADDINELLVERWRRHTPLTSTTPLDVTPRLTELLARQSAGNMLLIDVLIRSLIEQDALFLNPQQRLDLRAAREMSEQIEAKGAETLLAVLTSLFSRLDLTFQKILQVAAVGGQYFAMPILSKVLVIKDPTYCTLDLTETFRKSDTYQFLALTPPADWSFRHFLIHKSIYNMLPLTERTALHSVYFEVYSNALEETGQSSYRFQKYYHISNVAGASEQRFSTILDILQDSLQSGAYLGLEGFVMEMEGLQKQCNIKMTEQQEKQYTLVMALHAYHAGDHKRALPFFIRTMRLDGFPFPQSKVRLLYEDIKMLTQLANFCKTSLQGRTDVLAGWHIPPPMVWMREISKEKLRALLENLELMLEATATEGKPPEGFFILQSACLVCLHRHKDVGDVSLATFFYSLAWVCARLKFRTMFKEFIRFANAILAQYPEDAEEKDSAHYYYGLRLKIVALLQEGIFDEPCASGEIVLRFSDEQKLTKSFGGMATYFFGFQCFFVCGNWIHLLTLLNQMEMGSDEPSFWKRLLTSSLLYEMGRTEANTAETCILLSELKPRFAKVSGYPSYCAYTIAYSMKRIVTDAIVSGKTDALISALGDAADALTRLTSVMPSQFVAQTTLFFALISYATLTKASREACGYGALRDAILHYCRAFSKSAKLGKASPVTQANLALRDIVQVLVSGKPSRFKRAGHILMKAQDRFQHFQKYHFWRFQVSSRLALIQDLSGTENAVSEHHVVDGQKLGYDSETFLLHCFLADRSQNV